MSIDINSLIVGCHVRVNDKRAKVISVESTGIVGCKADDDWLRVMADDIKPIRITPELLAELGFQYRDNAYWERWFLGSFDIERKEGSSYFDYNSEIRLEHLHELEDLYYLIYGVELIEE